LTVSHVHSGVNPKIELIASITTQADDACGKPGDVFEVPNSPGQVPTLVNFLGFALHYPELSDRMNLFWKQLVWIQSTSLMGRILTSVNRSEENIRSRP
jgi:hypothetical protein